MLKNIDLQNNSWSSKIKWIKKSTNQQDLMEGDGESTDNQQRKRNSKRRSIRAEGKRKGEN